MGKRKQGPFQRPKVKSNADDTSKKERKDVEVYVNNKQLRQVKTMKYLGIIIDNKLTFRKHIKHVTEKCRKIIFALSNSAKLNWGLSHKALKTLYTRGIQLLLLLYGAPVWAEILEKTSHRKKLECKD